MIRLTLFAALLLATPAGAGEATSARNAQVR